MKFNLICLLILNLALFSQGFISYISPPNDAKYVNPENRILFRSKSQEHIIVELSGSLSGAIKSELMRIDDETYSCIPENGFIFSEIITVHISTVSSHFSSKFTIRDQPYTNVKNEIPNQLTMNQFRYAEISQTEITYPIGIQPVDIPVNNSASAGYIFISNISEKPNLLILDNSGKPIFFREMPNLIYDFKKVHYKEKDYLSYFLVSEGKFFLLDQKYNVVDNFTVVNGYSTDFHEFEISSNDEVFMGSYDAQIVDLTPYGGSPNQTVIGYIIQKFNSSKNLVFQWRSWDHYPLNVQVHGNSIEIDTDGHMIVSFRGTSEIAKINTTTGDFIWRLGGDFNEFQFINDPRGISFQHDARVLSNGNITLLDNGNLHNPQYTRAIEYKLDIPNKTANLVWEYRNSPETYSPFMGNVQRLPGGNTLIGYGGSKPTLIETKSDGTKVYELSFTANVNTYRAFRFEWNGIADKPFLWDIRVTGSPYQTKLNYQKFGDKNVNSYNIYVNNLFHTNTSNEFFFLNSLTQSSTHNITVKAVNNSSQESLTSNTVTIVTPVDTIGPAAPIIVSGLSSDKRVFLEWQKSPESDVKTYFIYGDTIENSNHLIDSVSASVSNHVISGLINNVTYFFSIRSEDYNRNRSSSSNSIILSPKNIDVEIDLFRLPILNESYLVIRPFVKADSLQLNLAIDSKNAHLDYEILTDQTYYAKVKHDTSGTYSFSTKAYFPNNIFTLDTSVYQITILGKQSQHLISKDIHFSFNNMSSEQFSISSQYDNKTNTFEVKSNRNIESFYEISTNRMNSKYFSIQAFDAGKWTDLPSYIDESNLKVISLYNKLGKFRMVEADLSKFEPVQKSFRLLQNYPNPFNPRTAIHFESDKADRVSLTIYNNLGQVIRRLIDTKLMDKSHHVEIWNGKNDKGQNVSSGIYFYQLKTSNSVLTKKMLLIK